MKIGLSVVISSFVLLATSAEHEEGHGGDKDHGRLGLERRLPAGGDPYYCEDIPLGLKNIFPTTIGCTVVLMNQDSKLEMSHGDPTGVDGNVCTADNNEIKASGSQRVTGDVLVSGTNLDYDDSSVPPRVEGTVYTGIDDVSQLISDIAMLSETYATQCDEEIEKIKIDEDTETNYCGNQGYRHHARRGLGGYTDTKYVCVDELEVKAKWTLLGNCNIVFNVKDSFKVNQGETDVYPGRVIANYVGTSDIAFSGGGGGLNCCKSIWSGSILAPNAKVKLSPGLVNGVVASGKDVVLSSGSFVKCDLPSYPGRALQESFSPYDPFHYQADVLDDESTVEMSIRVTSDQTIKIEILSVQTGSVVAELFHGLVVAESPLTRVSFDTGNIYASNYMASITSEDTGDIKTFLLTKDEY